MAWLQLDYVDHLMTHFPADWSETPERSSPERRQEEWLALESIYNKGEARSIGISHYCTQHIDDIMEVATVNPSIDQVGSAVNPNIASEDPAQIKTTTSRHFCLFNFV